MPKKHGKSSEKVRYALVGLGHIAQVAVLPGFQQARNTVLTGLVSGTPKKLEVLSRKYKVPNTWSYDEYEDCLHSGQIDAVYIALPNDLHHDYVLRAAKAGIHVLCEKPLAVTAQDCAEMGRVAQKNGVKLMTAYRLHCEETNLRASELVASGRIGEPRYFNSCFSYQITDEDNIRLKRARGGGTLYDIGVYCLNAARYIFRDDPVEVFAFSVSNGDRRFRETDEMSACVLRFPGDKLATFTTSFGAVDTDYYEVVGTKGSVRVEPAYEYVGELSWTLKIGEKETEKSFAARDQFGAEISYFSECVLKGRDPEPDAQEGWIDVQVIEALYKSAKTGRPVKLPKFERRRRPELSQQIKLPPVKEPKVIAVDSPHD
jgi:glucose-fructose oxidoreductase